MTWPERVEAALAKAEGLIGRGDEYATFSDAEPLRRITRTEVALARALYMEAELDGGHFRAATDPEYKDEQWAKSAQALKDFVSKVESP